MIHPRIFEQIEEEDDTSDEDPHGQRKEEDVQHRNQNEVEEFLGVNPAITEENFYFNSTKGFYCATETRMRGVWECTKKKCLSKSKGRPKPPLAPGTETRLRRFYREHNEIFFQLMGRDFGWNEKIDALEKGD